MRASTLQIVLIAFLITGSVSAQESWAALIAETHERIAKGDVSGALQNLSILQTRSPNNPEVQLAIGEMFQELAALRAEQLEKVAPESAAAHELLGKSLEARGKLDEAAAEYSRAIEKAPQRPGLHFLLGNVNWKRRRLDAAQREFEQELRINPLHTLANLRMGEILLDTDRDQPTRAISFLRNAVAGDPNSLEAHRELGKALRVAHDYSEAAKELQLVAARAPNDDTVHAQLAALYRETGDSERARREIELHAKILRERREASQQVHTQRAR